jgi:hypothetical protein
MEHEQESVGTPLHNYQSEEPMKGGADHTDDFSHSLHSSQETISRSISTHKKASSCGVLPTHMKFQGITEYKDQYCSAREKLESRRASSSSGVFIGGSIPFEKTDDLTVKKIKSETEHRSRFGWPDNYSLRQYDSARKHVQSQKVSELTQERSTHERDSESHSSEKPAVLVPATEPSRESDQRHVLPRKNEMESASTRSGSTLRGAISRHVCSPHLSKIKYSYLHLSGRKWSASDDLHITNTAERIGESHSPV